MAAQATEQLNMNFTYFPTAMLAKIPQSKRRKMPVKYNDAQAVSEIFGFNQDEGTAPATDNGAANFKPKNGKQRYSANKLAIITLINNFRDTLGYIGRLPHALFERQLGLNHVTINHNLAQLRTDGIIKRENGVNDYCINPEIEFSEKDYLIIYNFLLEKLNLGGIVKKLNYNAVIALCYFIRHYFEVKEKSAKKGKNNITPEEAYFIGGKQRIATLLNVAESTANDAIWELINTKAIFRKAFYIDDNCQEVICDGKGNSGNKQTVYVLNSKIIRWCEKIHAQMDANKEKRAKRAEKAAQKAKRHEAKNYKQHSKKAQKRNNKAEQRRRSSESFQRAAKKWIGDEPRGVVNEWASTIEKLRRGAEPPEPFEEFTQHNNRPPTGNEDK